MKITYINHSSFLVETGSVIMLFDYTDGEIPYLDKSKPLFVFASHAHSDHFSKKIFDLAKTHTNVKFILSSDIPKKAASGENVQFLAPYAEYETDGLNIKTLKSTDEGVAFFIKTDGLKIYHAGDLNNWYWEGEPDEWNRQMGEAYINEISKIKGENPDVAFLLLDPRQGIHSSLCITQFMETVGAKNIFPMHFWGDYSVCRKIKELPPVKPYAENIFEISKKGQSFEI
ncbi:MBL fold metallo-hydrolase [Anaerotignum faecicola]|nr:MBL fold metallo-hydrolase [Anaerotignum faecicola]